ncbi:hypothetical protein CMQ_6031 [Grosmannia clavigera kw1407]|uniref:Uncharacterized protein n=1 Tax=Grosmannia clavigera (strain kw1407 / UAMH 11150) TaxID=655863 RepID=F0XLW1_GROCL|nr:uncharacterized protein CMQ_6031 [Grosmannia clavigera kw1407]EFX01089.1 hypothetical protein CMQ_6031 [Grosmannia clavigera kw1407]
MSLTGGPWNLQEAITEQQTVTHRAGQQLTFDVQRLQDLSGVSTRSREATGDDAATCWLRVMAGTTVIGTSRFLKLCFHGLGDLKAASQTFLKLGLRCTTQVKPIGRTSSHPALATSSHQHQQWANTGPANVVARAQSYQVGYQPEFLNMAGYAAPQAWDPGSLESRFQSSPVNALKRRASLSLSSQAGLRSRLRRESSSFESTDATIRRSEAVSQSQSPFSTQPEAMHHSQPAAYMTSAAAVSKPPPRRELPQSITRHISLTPSQTEISYISLVGGYPTQVTAMGKLAGDGSLMHHPVASGSTLAPLAKRVILQSSTYQWMWDRIGRVEQTV